ncbi:carboxypeptidase Y inhibitor [Apiospora rasikravindrae]|uniref:Carboxypeptidase Y inhibitor n=1 Tax=Apiospora rasikravindrae TaxID=990691 RepID=A0ABR1SJK8_9PEZI
MTSQLEVGQTGNINFTAFNYFPVDSELINIKSASGLFFISTIPTVGTMALFRQAAVALMLLSARALARGSPEGQVVLSSDETVTRESKLHMVQEELKEAEIIPTVIDDFTPSFILDAEWSSSNYASLGNTMKVKKLQHAPHITLSEASDSKASLCGSNMTYIVTLTDPDAPSRDNPKWSEMCHFIATGLTLSSPSDTACSKVHFTDLQDIIPYKPPGPPPKTGKHRYVFLAFAPANGTTEPIHVSKPEDRQHWGTGKEGHGVRDWAKANGLKPVAANFIYAKNKKQ